MSKFFELEFINGIIRKLTYRGRQGSVYNFKYDNLNRVKNTIDLSNGIYIINKDDGSMDVYIGQTTSGTDRFKVHHKMKEYQDTATINFYSFEGQRPNKTLLDYMEKKVIEMGEASKYNLLNGNSGNKADIRGIDMQDAEENMPTLVNLMKVFGIDLTPETDSTQEIQLLITNKTTFKEQRSHDEDFFGKSEDFDFTIRRKDELWILLEGSKVKARDKYREYNGEVPNIGSFYKKFIDVVGDDNKTKKDIVWKSISPLVAFAKGNESNPGWNTIKNKEGKTPHEVYRED